MKLRRSLSRPGFWIVGLSLLWAGLLIFNVVPELRGSFGWQWPLDFVRDLRRLLPIALGAIAYIGVAFRLLRNRTAAGLLLWVMAGSIALPLAAAYARDDVLFRFYAITVSGVTGWHRAAAGIQDLGATLRDWPSFITAASEYSSHVALSPPGLVVIYYAANALLSHLAPLADWLATPLRLLQCQDMALMANSNPQLASAWLGMLTPVWSSLTILVLYRLGRSTFGPDAARWAVIWWPLVPSFVIFAPLPYTLYPLPALIMIDLLLMGLRRNRPAWVLLAGVVMSALTFVSFALIPLILLAGLLTLGMYWIKIRSSEPAPSWRWPLQMGLWYGLGLSAIWLIYYAVAGLSPWGLMLAASSGHLALDRPYWPWLVLHANDFFMFTGWPLVLMAGVGIWSSVRRLARRAPPAEQDIMVLASFISLALLDLSGTMRGESGRILLFFSPMVLLAAASALREDQALGRALTMTQGLLLVVMIASLNVLGTGFGPAPAAPAVDMASAPAESSFLPSGAIFGKAAKLTAFAGQIVAQPDTAEHRAVLTLWLRWQALKQMDAPYYLAVIPVSPSGQAAPAATLLQPFQQSYPMTCWRPGTPELQDRIDVPLSSTEAGDWWISLSLVNGETGQTVQLLNSDGSPDHQVGLGPFRWRSATSGAP